MNTKLKNTQKIQTPNTLQGQYAGFISRFLAFLIDVIVVIAALAIIGGIVTLILQFFGLTDFIDNLAQSTSIHGSVIRYLTAFWGVTAVSFLYIVISWTVTSGKTIGKGLIGVRIVPMDGSRITLGRAIWRYIAFWISVLVFCLGVLWILVSDKRQGWHDKMAKTCVIYDWPAREDILIIENLQNRWRHLKQTRFRLRRSRRPIENIDSGVSES